MEKLVEKINNKNFNFPVVLKISKFYNFFQKLRILKYDITGQYLRIISFRFSIENLIRLPIENLKWDQKWDKIYNVTII